MKIILDVQPPDLDRALAAAKSHLINAPDQMLHSSDYYLADGRVLHYHSRLIPESITVWVSPVVDAGAKDELHDCNSRFARDVRASD